MKIRQGFVSNSSSSSFLLMGDTYTLSQLMETQYFRDQYEKYCKEIDHECDFDSEDFEDFIKDDLTIEGLDIEYIYEFDEDEYYVGLDHSSLGEDETLRQFRLRAQSTIQKILGLEANVSWIQECWRS